MTPRTLLGGLVAALALTTLSTAAHAKCDDSGNPSCTISTIVCQVRIPRCAV